MREPTARAALRSARLTFVPLGREHAAEVKALFGDPGVRAIYGDGRDADDRVDAWIAWSQSQPEKNAVGHWVLASAEVPFVGLCGVMRMVVDGVEDLEVGYLLRDASTGRGYATEAAAFACDYTFASFDVPRVISIIHVDNVPSMRVAERNGFVFARETRWREMDVRIYVMTREAWESRRRVDGNV